MVTRNEKIGGTIAIAVFSISMTIALLLPSQAQAQQEPIDKIFQKNFCASEETILDDILYNNGQQISYDSSGCPVSTKVIHDWNNISTARQILITNRLATNGYEEVVQEIIGQTQQ